MRVIMGTQEKNKSKRKLKPVPVLILAVLLILITTTMVWAFRAKPKDESVNISISGVGETTGNANANESGSDAKQTKISIDMDSCAIPIGTTLKVTASVDPAAEVGKTINWSSSDQNVFTVDSEGIITIKGKGTSALTATIGNTSDAIVIEGIANDNSAKSENNLPVFNLLSVNGYTNGNTGNGTAGSGTSDKNTSVNNSGNTGNTGNTGNGANTSNTGNTGNSDNNNSLDNNAGNAGNSNSSNNSDNSNNSNNTGGEVKSTDLYQNLGDMGYTQRLSNVYVYEENNTYYGEIIIQSNVTIIYIKQRCDGFDTKIKEVIAKLLPEGNSEVWNNYLSA
jgi:hypothetical protein